MTENKPSPGDPPLSALLREVRPIAELPPYFQSKVWRRIESASAATQQNSWLEAFASLILRPRFAVAAATLLLVAGIATGVIEGRQLARHDAQMEYVASVAPQFVH